MIYDLFAKQVLATNTRSFKVELAPASTALYFTGKANQVQSLL
jgi:hypothetical protein